MQFCPSYWLSGASPLPLDVGYLFWWDLTFSCRWLFSSKLQFWSSHRRRWVHVLLLRHLAHYGFPSCHKWMWELDHKESWAPKNWCFWTVVLEKTLESPLDGKQIQPVNSKGNQSWIFIERTDAEAEAPTLWPPEVKNWLTGKDPDAGKDWVQEKEMTEDKMVGWHHQLDGHESEQAPRVGDGQGSLACCSPWGLKESDASERLNWTKLIVAIWGKGKIKII